MNKIFKGISVLAATAALGTGIALSTGCAGTNGTYYGEYHYTGAYGSVYGVVVEVTVENNIITKVKNITNSDNEYAVSVQKDADGKAQNWTVVSAAGTSAGWDADSVKNWTSHECWLLQQYEGWSVADILDIPVYTDYSYTPKLGEDGKPIMVENEWTGQLGYVWVQDYGTMGEPCKQDSNKYLVESGLLINESTQGSGRVLLAVQNALGK